MEKKHDLQGDVGKQYFPDKKPKMNTRYYYLFILLCISFPVFSQKVSVDLENAPLKVFFDVLQKQIDVALFYNENLISARVISIHAKNTDLRDLLSRELPKFRLSYRYSNKQITILPGSPTTPSAQQMLVTVKGRIFDSAQPASPVSSATVTEQGTKNAVVTRQSGSFTLSVSKGATLVVTRLGFQPWQMKIDKEELDLKVSLQDEVSELEEVVVTALGIKREQKALGYSATTVKGEQLTDALSNNWTDALSGKVAGLNLVRSNAGPAGSNKIILRGENNLTGDNDALIVVDGVVINQGSGRTTAPAGTGAYLDADSPADYGSSLNDINPEDIDEVTVLKGPSASALYGQRGANGAIVITTKSGKPRSKGIGVTVNSNTSIESINRWPDLQYEYGQGVDGATYYSYNASADGNSTRSTSSAWGPKFDGQEFFQYDPITQTQAKERTPWEPYVNDVRRFFDTGKTFTNSVSVDGGSEKTTARFSFTNVNNDWIIPNTGYKRNTVALSVNQKLSDKLSISTKINYTNKWSDNLPVTGYNNQAVMYWFIAWQPGATVDWLKDYWKKGSEGALQNYPYSSYPDNPYLITNEMLNGGNRHGLTGNVQASYQFTKELSLTVRTSLDFAADQRTQQRPFDTEKFKKGMYRTQNIYSQEASTDFLLRYQKKINKDWEISATGGGSMLANNYNRDEVRADSLLYPSVYTLANSAGVLASYPYKSKYLMNSFYGLATMSYKDFLFVDVTGRNDWNSVLATKTSTKNVSFFYPSVNTGLVLSELFKMPQAFNYAKVRASVSGVGSGRNVPYLTAYKYSPQVLYPGGLSNPTQLTNPDLKPLYTSTIELGAEVKMFKNRFGFDVTLYSSDTKDQILTAIIDRSSGYNNAIVNAGEVTNRGIELALNGTPIKQKNGLTWNVNATFTANRNKVVELLDSLPQLVLQNGPGSRGAIIAIPGGSMGDLYGRGYSRAPDGQIIYENGLPKITTDMKYIGNTNPKWKASLSNEFNYKRFRFSFLIDGQYGAVGYSLTSAVLAEEGKTTNTLPGRYNGIIGSGVIENPDGTFRPNDVIAQDIADYYVSHYGRDNVEGTTYSTDFIKLREARLDYNLPSKLLSRLGLQRAVIGVYGRDLITISKWPVFDPEFGMLNGADINKGFELGQFPSTRTFGFNLVVGI